MPPVIFRTVYWPKREREPRWQPFSSYIRACRPFLLALLTRTKYLTGEPVARQCSSASFRSAIMRCTLERPGPSIAIRCQVRRRDGGNLRSRQDLLIKQHRSLVLQRRLGRKAGQSHFSFGATTSFPRRREPRTWSILRLKRNSPNAIALGRKGAWVPPHGALPTRLTAL